MGAGYDEVQAKTLETADMWGERWSIDDLDFVIAFTDDARDEDLALATGRTLASLWAIQHRIRTIGVEGVRGEFVRREIAERARRPRVEVGFDFVTTFPPGDW